MNQTATSATTSRQKRVRTNPITTTQMIDLTTPAPTTKTTRSPTKSAIQALEGITASLPSSLHPIALHFGNKLISIRSKRITKENIAKRMAKEANYIPKSAKSHEFQNYFILVRLVENSSIRFRPISCSQVILKSSKLVLFFSPKIACLHVSFTAYENFYKLSNMNCLFVLIFHFPFFRISECRNPTIKHISNCTYP